MARRCTETLVRLATDGVTAGALVTSEAGATLEEGAGSRGAELSWS